MKLAGLWHPAPLSERDKVEEMSEPDVTVVVVTRERFSLIPRSLECRYLRRSVISRRW